MIITKYNVVLQLQKYNKFLDLPVYLLDKIIPLKSEIKPMLCRPYIPVFLLKKLSWLFQFFTGRWPSCTSWFGGFPGFSRSNNRCNTNVS